MKKKRHKDGKGRNETVIIHILGEYISILSNINLYIIY